MSSSHTHSQGAALLCFSLRYKEMATYLRTNKRYLQLATKNLTRVPLGSCLWHHKTFFGLDGNKHARGVCATDPYTEHIIQL